MNNNDELEIMHAANVAPSFVERLSYSLLARAKELGFDDIIIRKRSDGATALVAVKRREVMQ